MGADCGGREESSGEGGDFIYNHFPVLVGYSNLVVLVLR